jgi:hypothetical protein
VRKNKTSVSENGQQKKHRKNTGVFLHLPLKSDNAWDMQGDKTMRHGEFCRDVFWRFLLPPVILCAKL